jgi:hypothetical protein
MAKNETRRYSQIRKKKQFTFHKVAYKEKVCDHNNSTGWNSGGFYFRKFPINLFLKIFNNIYVILM